jgi:glycosyltransferase involved in cell wall biosynthesis
MHRPTTAVPTTSPPLPGAATPGGLRAVVLVGNPAAPYSRALRIARALVAEGYAVEIAAVAADGLPERELDGEILTRRYRPSGWLAAMATMYRGSDVAGRAPKHGPRLVRVARRVVMAAIRWWFWPHTMRGWWATLGRELEPADLYHACGSLTVGAALSARSRAPGGPGGRKAIVIYDAIDDVIDSNHMLGFPPLVRRWLARRERGWARRADGRTTVNEALATRLGSRWRLPPPCVVPNYPEPGDVPPGDTRDLIRDQLGLSAATRIVLFQGRLAPNLGIEAAAEAVLMIADAALVLIGFGRWAERCRARDDDPRFRGRHFTLPPKHPDELAGWTASADVSVVPLPAVSLNQRLSSPNKFWESIAVGTPVVAPTALEVMAALIREHGLGRVASGEAPGQLADALKQVLDRPADERRVERRRIAMIARDRFSWPAAAATYRGLVRELQP